MQVTRNPFTAVIDLIINGGERRVSIRWCRVPPPQCGHSLHTVRCDAFAPVEHFTPGCEANGCNTTSVSFAALHCEDLVFAVDFPISLRDSRRDRPPAESDVVDEMRIRGVHIVFHAQWRWAERLIEQAGYWTYGVGVTSGRLAFSRRSLPYSLIPSLAADPDPFRFPTDHFCIYS